MGSVRGSFVGMVLAAVAVAGCDDLEVERVVQVHQPLGAAAATLGVGENCEATGRVGCLSGYCLHSSPRPQDYFCTTSCEDSACPASWSCQQSGMGSFCTPPRDWKSQRAVVPVAAGRHPGRPEWADAGARPPAATIVSVSGDGGVP